MRQVYGQYYQHKLTALQQSLQKEQEVVRLVDGVLGGRIPLYGHGDAALEQGLVASKVSQEAFDAATMSLFRPSVRRQHLENVD